MPATWFGFKYPSLLELENLAEALGAPVSYERYKKPFLQWDLAGPLCIVIPTYDGQLARAWGIAHEVGHLVLNHGPLHTNHSASPMEMEADVWASCALLPEERIRHYQNASVGTLMRALHKNFQPIPESGGVRKLAARIAYARLRALEVAG